MVQFSTIFEQNEGIGSAHDRSWSVPSIIVEDDDRFIENHKENALGRNNLGYLHGGGKGELTVDHLQVKRLSVDQDRRRSSLFSDQVLYRFATEYREREKIDGLGSLNDEVTNKKDVGWSWIVCLASFTVGCITMGTISSFGKVFNELMEQFGTSYSETAWIGSLSTWMLFGFSSLSSLLAQHHGYRLMTIVGCFISCSGLIMTSFVLTFEMFYLTYGFIFGLGSSIVFAPSLLVLADYFDQKLALASGIVSSGWSLGVVVFSPLMHELFMAIGWKYTFRVLAGITALQFIAGLAMRPVKKLPDIDPLPQKNDGFESRRTFNISTRFIIAYIKRLCVCLFDKDLLTEKRYMAWVVVMILSNFGYFIPHTYMVQYAVEHGVPSGMAANLLVYFGIASAIGRLFWGILSDTGRLDIAMVYQVCLFLSGIASIACSVSSTYYWMLGYLLIYGFLDGSFIGLMFIVTIQCVGHEKAVSGWGMLLVFESFSLLLGPPAAGWMVSWSGSYKVLFYMAGGPMVVGSVLMTYIVIMERRSKSFEVKGAKTNLAFEDKDWLPTDLIVMTRSSPAIAK